MIAKLKGLLDQTGSDWLVIDVGGVGYLVFASGRTLSALPRLGEPLVLVVETHVREDHIHLYGFSDSHERDMFRLLISVSGVGAKVALAILSVMEPHALAHAIAAQDKVAVARAQGVGPRLAQRVVTELKDKVAGVAFAAVPGLSPADGAQGGSAPMAGGSDGGSGGSGPGRAPDERAALLEDAISALVNLGYGRSDAFAALSVVAQQQSDETLSLQGLIRAGLKELAR
ncbi:Holliday junction ATP-dependent DNA helicase RuvA [Iodidimonas nitroreducens]|uniref:Holliday junction branch migration complex subunit RuvA n=1 Tax=Iodidimonas nitroreducens TaxID=1236968 RepID=A0A5A7NBF3_9PROT|nr:Holliday junction branch migration protein RuvA [Iodidimonas nitroreducens]GAK32700.1 Holliday junction ATP-dependent DNA helicase RuvA [alpha proteobacterium Q-1]GER04965.1 Holliday junction ATP-dependent DNA helicase RuvA [Iodidimonas nitroreducens]